MASRRVFWAIAAFVIIIIYLFTNLFLIIDANSTLQSDIVKLEEINERKIREINDTIRRTLEDNQRLANSIYYLRKIKERGKREDEDDDDVRQLIPAPTPEMIKERKERKNKNIKLMCVSPYGITYRPMLPYYQNDDIPTIFKEVPIFGEGMPIIGPSNGGSWGDLSDDIKPELLLHNNFQATDVVQYNNSFFTQNVSFPGVSKGSCWGDLDKDGWDDLVLVGNGPDKIYKNVKSVLTLEYEFDINYYGEGRFCQLLDLNKDGHLDILRINSSNHLSVFSRGRGKIFEDITKRAALPATLNFIVGVAFFSREPVLILSPHGGDLEFYDLRKMPFENITFKFIDIPRYTDLVDARVYDINHDKLLDLVLLFAFLPPVIAYNIGQYTFYSVSLPAMPQVYGYIDALNVDLEISDFNNDMRPDLFVVRRTKYANAPNILYINDGETFIPLYNGGGASGTSLGQGHSVSLADFNFDGAMDMVVFNGGGEGEYNVGPTQLFVNTPGENNWVQIELIGTGDTINGYGTLVGVRANGVMQIQLLSPTHNHKRLHFGIGNATVIDKILIFWPIHHATQTFYGIAPNQLVTLLDFVSPLYTEHAYDVMQKRGTHQLKCAAGLERIKPSFFILGIWKAGTTSLAATLDYHPQVLLGASKEYYYFTRYYEKMPIEWYWSLFPCGDPGYHVSYDATAGNLFDKKVPELLFPHHPHAKFIIMLRDPIARAYSHFYMTTHASNEDGPRLFHEAMTKQVDRFRECVAEWQTTHSDADVITAEAECSTKPSWLYLNAGIYYHAVKRWFKYFPAKNFIFNQFNDLVGPNGDQVVNSIQDFLGLELYELETKTKNKSPKRAQMFNSTVTMLQDFYRPFNKQLYELLKHDFGWDNNT